MGHDESVGRFSLGGVPVSDVTMGKLVEAIGRRIAMPAPTPGAFVVFRDAHGVVRSQDDERLRQAHHEALLVCPDGRPLVWVGRMKGYRNIRQVPGIASMEAVCRAGADAGWRHYFLGGGPGVAERLAAAMTARVPGLQVAGYETPPFRALDDAETAAMRARIRASGAQILWVGLGTPKQELFMAEHAPHLPGTVAMGVGAAFDVNIGTIPRSPRLLQVAGLEWAYRLAREPKRLYGRYRTVVPRFAMLAAAELGANLRGTRGPERGGI